METEVDYQVAAPAEMRTPNLHRANNRSKKSADGRMATEATRLKRKNPLIRKRKTGLTLTGLLMEGLGRWKEVSSNLGTGIFSHVGTELPPETSSMQECPQC